MTRARGPQKSQSYHQRGRPRIHQGIVAQYQLSPETNSTRGHVFASSATPDPEYGSRVPSFSDARSITRDIPETPYLQACIPSNTSYYRTFQFLNPLFDQSPGVQNEQPSHGPGIWPRSSTAPATEPAKGLRYAVSSEPNERVSFSGSSEAEYACNPSYSGYNDLGFCDQRSLYLPNTTRGEMCIDLDGHKSTRHDYQTRYHSRAVQSFSMDADSEEILPYMNNYLEVDSPSNFSTLEGVLDNSPPLAPATPSPYPAWDAESAMRTMYRLYSPEYQTYNGDELMNGSMAGFPTNRSEWTGMATMAPLPEFGPPTPMFRPLH